MSSSRDPFTDAYIFNANQDPRTVATWTEEIKMDVVQRDGTALRLIPYPDRTKELCYAAVEQNAEAYQYVPDSLKTEYLSEYAVTLCGRMLEHVPKPLVDENVELCLLAVQNDPKAIMFTPINSVGVAEFVLEKDPSLIGYIVKSNSEYKKLFDRSTLKSSDSYKLCFLTDEIPSFSTNRWTVNHACCEGDWATVELFTKDPEFDPTPDDATKPNLLATAAYYGRLKTVDVLLKDGRANPYNSTNRVFVSACQNKMLGEDTKLRVVRRLLEDPRTRPSAYKNAALKCTAMDDCAKLAELILSDPRTIEPLDGVLCLAIHNCSMNVLRVLLNDERIRPLLNEEYRKFAKRRGCFELIETILNG